MTTLGTTRVRNGLMQLVLSGLLLLPLSGCTDSSDPMRVGEVPQDLVGVYWETGDRSFSCLSLELEQNGTYLFRMTGCLGEMERVEGVWRAVPERPAIAAGSMHAGATAVVHFFPDDRESRLNNYLGRVSVHRGAQGRDRSLLAEHGDSIAFTELARRESSR